MKYFSINEESANVHDITEIWSFEDQTLILVQSNGCHLEDTKVTRGISCPWFLIFFKTFFMSFTGKIWPYNIFDIGLNN